MKKHTQIVTSMRKTTIPHIGGIYDRILLRRLGVTSGMIDDVDMREKEERKIWNRIKKWWNNGKK